MSRGTTPLHRAAWERDVAAVKKLLADGADVNALSKCRGRATQFGGRWVNIVNSKCGDTPLHNAAWLGYAAVVEVLLAAGAEINLANQHGETPLHSAVNLYYPEDEDNIATVKVLLAAGAKISATKDGKTPIDIAREKKKWKSVSILEGHQ